MLPRFYIIVSIDRDTYSCGFFLIFLFFLILIKGRNSFFLKRRNRIALFFIFYFTSVNISAFHKITTLKFFYLLWCNHLFDVGPPVALITKCYLVLKVTSKKKKKKKKKKKNQQKQNKTKQNKTKDVFLFGHFKIKN